MLLDKVMSVLYRIARSGDSEECPHSGMVEHHRKIGPVTVEFQEYDFDASHVSVTVGTTTLLVISWSELFGYKVDLPRLVTPRSDYGPPPCWQDDELPF